MATADTIAQKLNAGLNPRQIDVKDVSHKHAGHAGWREGGGTHFEVTIKA
ncbi:MAG: BolA family transcriptional regulator, partial [Alphaproteobacteria bacterium]|nr:BolA family transcriptional regulator [Alphaproteobacteria bacterium]